MEDMLDRPALSAWLGVPIRTLAQWAYEGKGPRFYKVGRHARYRQEDVETWLAERVKEPSKGVA
jgi:excisionase family DNA binding protein